MGQIAEDMLDGFACSECGIYFQEEHGYPVLCEHCWSMQSNILCRETTTKTYDQNNQLVDDHSEIYFITETGLQKAHIPEIGEKA